MADWIALDENTQKALREALGPYGKIDSAQGSPLRSALNAEGPSAILLPAAEDGFARLLTLERRKQREQGDDSSPILKEYVGTGFLGLSGSSEEVEPEPEGKKKSWWKRIVD